MRNASSLLVLFIGLIAQAYPSEWVILKDGTVGKIVCSGGAGIDIVLDGKPFLDGPVKIELGDGTKREVKPGEIREQFSSERVKREVYRITDTLKQESMTKETGARLLALGQAAVPPLIERMKGHSRTMKLIVLDCLQQCWSEDAREAVRRVSATKDTEIRRTAIALLRARAIVEQAKTKKGERPKPKSVTRSLVRDINKIRREESRSASQARMMKSLVRHKLWSHVTEFLPRYYNPAFTEQTLKILKEGPERAIPHCIASLIHQFDNSAPTKKLITEFLFHRSPVVRDRAAEYFRWHGSIEDKAALSKARDAEKDVYARASLIESMAAIDNRANRFPDKPVVMPGDPDTPLERYRRASGFLKKSPSRTAWEFALNVFKTCETFEPHVNYENVRLRRPISDARIELTQLFAGYTLKNLATPSNRHTGLDTEPDIEPAQSLRPPVRKYFDIRRRSFGKFVPPDAKVFADSYHVGDDVSSSKIMETVVAIGDGIVRGAHVALPSLGGIVIIEHESKAGKRFCSLYAHLGPLVCVRVGDKVKQGQKIGTLGRSWTWENGGYLAHLHFGIHKGAFLLPDLKGKAFTRRIGDSTRELTVEEIDGQMAVALDAEGNEYRVPRIADWITGYLSKEMYKKNRAGWMNPQTFIKNHTRYLKD